MSNTHEPIQPVLLGLEWYTDNPGGLHRYLADLLVALRAGGVPARAVVLGPATDAPVGVAAAGRASQSLPRRLVSYALAARRAGAGTDVVDAHFALFAVWPVTVGRLRRLPLVVHFQGPWAEESESDGRRGGLATTARLAVERAVYRRAGEVIVLSAAFQRVAVERYGVAPWRVTVLPPGVDLARFTPGDGAAARETLGLPVDATVVVAVRRLVPRMGVDVLLEAWAAARRPGAVLVLVGDGPERPALEQAGRRLGVEGSVRFLGIVDEDALVACYRAADLAVVPSVELEGFGLVVLEALACGVPVLGTDAGGLPETVARLDPALVVPAGDAPALGRRLDAVLSDPSSLPSADRCRSFAEQFSWQAVAGRHREVYERAARPRRARPRVVFLDHCARPSGGELAMLRLLPALDADTHVILAEDGPLAGLLAQAGVSVEVLRMDDDVRELRRQRVPRPPARALLGTAAYAAALARRLRRLRPDLVHTNSLKAALYGGVAARLAGLPVVWHIRDRIAGDYLPTPAVALVRAVGRVVPAAIIANSRSTLDTVARGATPAAVVHSPVDVAGRPARRGTGGPLRVAMVGRIAPWKGQDLFLRAFARAFPAGGAEAVLIGGALFGEEAHEAALVRLAGDLGIAGRVRFLGHRADVAEQLAAMDALVHASVVPEPFGQVVVEGMAAGLPVVAAAAGGPAEVVTHGVDGLLYPPGDEEALAAALRRLAGDPDLRRRLGTAARARAEAFAPRVIAAQVEAVYRWVLEGPG